MNGTINILAIKPGEQPERLTIDNTLEARQKLVGGYIEAFGLMDGACIYCNEEGKINGMPLNRGITMNDATGEGGDSWKSWPERSSSVVSTPTAAKTRASPRNRPSIGCADSMSRKRSSRPWTEASTPSPSAKPHATIPKNRGSNAGNRHPNPDGKKGTS